MKQSMITLTLLFCSCAIFAMNNNQNNNRNPRRNLFNVPRQATHDFQFPSTFSVHFDYHVDSGDTTDLPKPNFNDNNDNGNENMPLENKKRAIDLQELAANKILKVSNSPQTPPNNTNDLMDKTPPTSRKNRKK